MAEKTPWKPKHLEVVKKGAKAIDEWREANGFSLLNLASANLVDTDLSYANLSYANLRAAELRGADLSGANLNYANLRAADLSYARLRYATLSNALLTNADLNTAKLRDTNLAGADLTHANLLGADLKDAELSDALLSAALLADVTEAKRLDRVRHTGPSTISAAALLRPTKKPWPIKFLRGIGLTNDEIEHALAIAAASKAIDFYSTFISYSQTDDAFAVKLHGALQGHGIRCWLDKHEVLPGDDIHGMINEGIRLWDKVLLVCTEDSLNSTWVKREITTALQKEERLEKERGREVRAIIPIDVDGYLFSDDCTMKFTEELRARHAAQFKGSQANKRLFHEQFHRVMKALRADEGARKPPPDPKL